MKQPTDRPSYGPTPNPFHRVKDCSNNNPAAVCVPAVEAEWEERDPVTQEETSFSGPPHNLGQSFVLFNASGLPG